MKDVFQECLKYMKKSQTFIQIEEGFFLNGCFCL